MKRFFLLLTIITFAFTINSFSQTPKTTVFVDGAKFGGFVEKDLSGNPINIADYKGKVVWTFNWTSFDENIVDKLIQTEILYRRYKRIGLEVIAINIDGRNQETIIKDFINKYNLSFLIGVGSTISVRYTAVIDKDGITYYATSKPVPNYLNFFRDRVIPVIRKGAVSDPLSAFAPQFFQRTYRINDKGIIEMLDSGTGYILEEIPERTGYKVKDIRISADDNFLYILYEDDKGTSGILSILETTAHQKIGDIYYQAKPLYWQFSNDEKILYITALKSNEGQIYITDLSSRKITKNFSVSTIKNPTIAVINDRAYLDEKVWDLKKGVVLGKTDGVIIAISPDGKYGYGIKENHLWLFDISNDTPLLQLTQEPIPTEYQFINANDYLFLNTKSKVIVVDMNGGKIQRTVNVNLPSSIFSDLKEPSIFYVHSDKNQFTKLNLKEDTEVIIPYRIDVGMIHSTSHTPIIDTELLELRKIESQGILKTAIKYYNDSDWVKAEAELLNVLKANPDNALANVYLGNIYIKQKKLDDAINAFKRAKENTPTISSSFAICEAYENLGYIYFKKGNYESALDEKMHTPECKDCVYILDDKEVEWWRSLTILGVQGILYYNKKDMDNAITSLMKGVEEVPTNPLAHYYLANALYESGKITEAVDSYQQAYSNGYPLTHQDIYRWFDGLIENEADGSVQFNEIYKEKNNDTIAVYVSFFSAFGHYLYVKKNPKAMNAEVEAQNAEEKFNKVIPLADKTPNPSEFRSAVYYFLAQTFGEKTLNNIGKYVPYSNKSIKENPNSKWAKRAKERCKYCN